MTCAVDRYIWEHGQEPDTDDYEHTCDECCADLPEQPTSFVERSDQILEWETVMVDGEPYEVPAKWSMIQEPVWKCSECGKDNFVL